MSDAKVAFYRSIGLTGALPDMEKAFFDGSYRKVPYVLAQSAVPVCLAPNGTVATNGLITLGTALPTTYSAGIWLRLPAGAVVGGSAGLYWAVMTSTTQGQVYTNFADPASEFIPSIPSGDLVAAIGSNAAYMQTTGADITLVNVTVPSGAMGAMGKLRYTGLPGWLNSAGTKTFKLYHGGVSLVSLVRTTSTNDQHFFELFNRGAGRQVHSNSIAPGSATSLSYRSVDTSVDQSFSFTGQLTAATDFILVEAATIEVFPS